MDVAAEILDRYEAVIGLEIHAQLLTRTKMFSPEAYTYGAPPNTQTHPISLGHPGTLPRPNKAAYEMAVRFGHAVEAEIQQKTHYSRKNYFYPDLPKGYQITQYVIPICQNGRLRIEPEGEAAAWVGIDKVILEEDSGKSIHDLDPFATLIDLNRAGVPLIEIVTAPDIRTFAQAGATLAKIRQLVRYLDICDGNMEEGSLRCDANISVRRRGSSHFGTKVEIKNLNSIRNLQRALEYEFRRQVALIESGGKVEADTRGFIPEQGITFTMRAKEALHDYRYFPEPDIPPVTLSAEWIEQVRAHMPPLPDVLFQRFTTEYGLSDYDARLLVGEKAFALYFEDLVKSGAPPKQAANWLNGPIRAWLNRHALGIDAFPVSPQTTRKVLALIESNAISYSEASQTLLPALIDRPEADPRQLAEQLGIIQASDEALIRQLIEEVLAEFPDKVAQYHAGKKGLMGMFMGQIMRRAPKKLDPRLTSQLLSQRLNQSS